MNKKNHARTMSLCKTYRIVYPRILDRQTKNFFEINNTVTKAISINKHVLQINNRKTGERCEICSKLTLKTQCL